MFLLYLKAFGWFPKFWKSWFKIFSPVHSLLFREWGFWRSLLYHQKCFSSQSPTEDYIRTFPTGFLSSTSCHVHQAPLLKAWYSGKSKVLYRHSAVTTDFTDNPTWLSRHWFQWSVQHKVILPIEKTIKCNTPYWPHKLWLQFLLRFNLHVLMLCHLGC